MRKDLDSVTIINDNLVNRQKLVERNGREFRLGRYRKICFNEKFCDCFYSKQLFVEAQFPRWLPSLLSLVEHLVACLLMFEYSAVVDCSLLMTELIFTTKGGEYKVEGILKSNS